MKLLINLHDYAGQMKEKPNSMERPFGWLYQLVFLIAISIVMQLMAMKSAGFGPGSFFVGVAVKTVMLLAVWLCGIFIHRLAKRLISGRGEYVQWILHIMVAAIASMMVIALVHGILDLFHLELSVITTNFLLDWISVFILAIIILNIHSFGKKESLTRVDTTTLPLYFKTLVDEVEDVIQVVDINGKVKYTNKALQLLVDYTAEEIEGSEAFRFIHPEDRERVSEEFRRLIGTAPVKEYEVEYRLVTKGGQIKYVSTRVVNALSNPNVKGVVAAVRDITQRKKGEQAIKESLSLNRAVIESTSEGILVANLHGNVIVFNQAFKNMWGIPDQILESGKEADIVNFITPLIANIKDVQPNLDKLKTDVDASFKITFQLFDGKTIECHTKPQLLEETVIGRIWSGLDITDRIRAERQQIEKGVAQAQFESLKNQVNPHFLFNSLNVLSSLVHIDAVLSEKFIDQLAKSYRYLLEQKDNELVPLKTEIDFVQSFTFLLKIRFEEKLQVKIELPVEVMNYFIAPLTLQLLIENAVKHNTISAEAPLIITIFTDSNDYLIVSNNLQLRAQQMASTHVGLKNIISRYKLLTSVLPEFKVENEKYIARIPLIESHA